MAKNPSKSLKVSKLSSKQAHLEHHVRHRITMGIGITIIAVLLALVLSLVIIPKVTNDIRLQRITAIYSSIQLPSQIYNETDNIFGDKRPYSWDASRTDSSSKTFVVGKSVTDTFTALDMAIRAAGYTQFEEAYPGSVSKEYHYKTDKGEYIRLNVESKLRLDAYQNEYWMTGKNPTNYGAIDPNAGPSLVTLKVNLDDNNE